jgi:hypothetical protein
VDLPEPAGEHDPHGTHELWVYYEIHADRMLHLVAPADRQYFLAHLAVVNAVHNALGVKVMPNRVNWTGRALKVWPSGTWQARHISHWQLLVAGSSRSD